MKKFYLKHSFIVIALSVGGWIALWLPAYLPFSPPNTHNPPDAQLDYIRYVLIMLMITGLCVIPIIAGVLIFYAAKVYAGGKISRLALGLMYLPMLIMAFSTFYDNVKNLALTLYSLPAALIYLILMIYLTLGFPLRIR
ncbi:hypothetical protein TRP66_14330 [Pseudomonas sp. JDS28PS106]|uniref:hypothetical protein n=1 Tax=Pseudomonas sp. JDS28PS106 TaxID=2497235 RepID=UPI002FD1228C